MSKVQRPGVPRVRAIREGEPNFQRVFEQAPLILAVLDREMRMLAVSDKLLEATGKSREEVVGRSVFDAFPGDPKDPETGPADLRRALERVFRERNPNWMAVQPYPVERSPEDGGGFEMRYWSPVNQPVFDDAGEVVYVFQVTQDVTEFVRLQEHHEQLSSAAAELEEESGGMKAEILRHSDALRDANRRLAEASAAKTEFLSRISHELRTPLTAIIGFSELLKQSGLDPERDEWAARILRASEHLVDLVNEVLDITRIESGDTSLAVRPVALDSVLEDTVALMRPLADRRSMRLLAPEQASNAYVLANRQRLQQVLINLISNAIKFNHPGGSAAISVRHEDGRTMIAVSDTGDGIPARDLPRIFEPFERLGAEVSGIEGTGLGLALSKKLVESMDGALTASSEPGRGSTFTVELRCADPDMVSATRTEP